ncbi:MAG: hypothetical protein K0S05_3131 [Agromyces sp.]|nr:hypothetical protein [Agromyces sp.]
MHPRLTSCAWNTHRNADHLWSHSIHTLTMPGSVSTAPTIRAVSGDSGHAHVSRSRDGMAKSTRPVTVAAAPTSASAYRHGAGMVTSSASASPASSRRCTMIAMSTSTGVVM